ncbi:MAG: sulfatase-like hydrolase/transferase [Carboxylicivirga sp.]|jgi:arylsulfatase A|nr:sulfatase-like hydrolase/transferase [Carboxylicivirga sp.]
MILRIIILVFVTSLAFCSIRAKGKEKNQPNIILIMADDMGYECIGANGCVEYSTPEIDKMAADGIRFTNCVSQPLCTPSRVKLMTGLRNYQNYEHFGYLNVNQKTFAHTMKDAGYTTCIAGKWQLNGIKYKDTIKDWDDNTKANKLGFDEYCLWQYTQHASLGGRFSNPLIEQNGQILERDKGSYGPDVFSNYIIDFIERNQERPFFVYYPMVLVHDPFVPTPDSELWNDEKLRRKHNKNNFKDMVEYCDMIVGKINQKLQELGLDDNTIVIFTGDNGTHKSIITSTNSGDVKGGKGLTTTAGTHVPLLIKYPNGVNKSKTYNGLVEFSDFYPTFAELVDEQVESDGISFTKLLKGKKNKNREIAVVHYDPKWGKHKPARFVRNIEYKLYESGQFFNIQNDVLEQQPLAIDTLSHKESKIYKKLRKELQELPKSKL